MKYTLFYFYIVYMIIYKVIYIIFFQKTDIHNNIYVLFTHDTILELHICMWLIHICTQGKCELHTDNDFDHTNPDAACRCVEKVIGSSTPSATPTITTFTSPTDIPITDAPTNNPTDVSITDTPTSIPTKVPTTRISKKEHWLLVSGFCSSC